MTYRPELDGIRALAVLSVIFAHAGFQIVAGGYIGVDIFFVLSGYLIGGIILRALETGEFSFKTFYLRRARRILPALFLVLLGTCIIAWWLLTPSQLFDFAPSVLSSILFLSNVYFWDLSGYFSPLAERQPLLHTWSLSIEEQYYLLFPLLAFVSYKFFNVRGLVTLVVGITVLSFVLAEWGSQNKPTVNYYFTFSRFWEILAGTICVLIEKRWGTKGSDISAGLGLVALIASVVLYDAQTPFPSAYALLPIIGTMLLLLYARAGTRTAALLSAKFIAPVGLISYSAYLWHQPVFAFYRVGQDAETNGWIAIPLIVLILGLAWISWRFVEQPFRSGGKQWSLGNFATTALAGLTFATLAVASCVLYFTDIALIQYSGKDLPLYQVSRRDGLQYMRARTKPFINRAFADDGRPKIFIIGDSYASDFINVLGEQELLGQLDLSVHVISANCGNLYLINNQDFPPKQLLPKCENISRYDSKHVQSQLRNADTVFIVSRWEIEFIPFIRESLENIKSLTKYHPIVIGPKYFAEAKPRFFQNIAANERPQKYLPISQYHFNTTSQLAKLGLNNYIDLNKLLCIEDGKDCPLVTPDGYFISIDGEHLTPSGAKYLGKRLFQSEPWLLKHLQSN